VDRVGDKAREVEGDEDHDRRGVGWLLIR